MWPYIFAGFGALAMAVTVAYAQWKGDLPERLVGGLIGLAWIGSYLLQDRAHNADPQWAVAWLDVALFVAFLAITARWRKPWLVVACASQLLTAATHIAFVLDPRIAAMGFMTAYYVWSYATLIALAWGTRLASRKRLATAAIPETNRKHIDPNPDPFTPGG